MKFLGSRKSETKNREILANFHSAPAGRGNRKNFNSAESRVLVSPVLDTSGSMAKVSKQSYQCTSQMIDTLQSTPSIGRRVDLEITTAGGRVEQILPFTCVLEIEKPGSFTPTGCTPLGEAVITALDSIEARVSELRAAEIEVVSSILVIISDGEANDHAFIDEAKKRLRNAEADKITVIPFLSRDGNGAALRDFCGGNYLDASTTDIPALFRKLTEVIRVVSQTAPSQVKDSSFVRKLMFGGNGE